MAGIAYPVHGAQVICDKGTQSAYLNVPERATSVGTGRMGIAADSAYMNIAGNFGQCLATTNKSECIKCFTGQWRNVSDYAQYGPYTRYYDKAVQYLEDALTHYNLYKKQIFAAMDTTNNINYFGKLASDVNELVAINSTVSYKSSEKKTLSQQNLTSLEEVKSQLVRLPYEGMVELNVSAGEDYYNGMPGERANNIQNLAEKIESNLALLKNLYGERGDKRLVLLEMGYHGYVRYCLSSARQQAECMTHVGDERVGLLTMNSTLRCSRMGVITFLTNGQELVSDEEVEQQQLANLRERVRRAIYAHYGFVEPSQSSNNIRSADDVLYENLLGLGVNSTVIDAMKDLKKVPFPKADGISDSKYQTEVTAKQTELAAAVTQTQAEVNGASSGIERQEAQFKLNVAQAAQEAFISETDYQAAETAVTEQLETNTTENISANRLIYTRQLADKVIVRFRVHEATEWYQNLLKKMNEPIDGGEEEASENEWAQENTEPEDDPYTLLAWLVLLEEDELCGHPNPDFGTVGGASSIFTPLEFLQNAIDDEEFKFIDYGIRIKIYLETKETFTAGVRAQAYALPVQAPQYGGAMTWNYGAYERNYNDHTGADFGPPHAYDICASYSGDVTTVVNNIGVLTVPSFGSKVCIKNHEINKDVHFCHMAKGSIVVSQEDFVLAGKYLGEKGNTGSPNMAKHLHYEIRPIGGSDRTHLDPNPYLPTDMQRDYGVGTVGQGGSRLP